MCCSPHAVTSLFASKTSRTGFPPAAPTAQNQAEHRAALQNVPEVSTSGLPAPYSSYRSPTLAEWLTNRYSEWQKRAQNESARRKLDSPKRYLLASDLGDSPLREIDTASVNAYVEWRLEVGTLTFATRKDGSAYRPRAKSVGARTINKSLKLISAALRLAHDEGLVIKLPKINYLPEDDARAILPPTEEQLRAIIPRPGAFGATVQRREAKAFGLGHSK
jgi:hypothetical protein